METTDQTMQTPSDANDRRQKDRRRWERYPVAGTDITIKSGTCTFQATALDESAGGIGVQTQEAVALETGQNVDLVYSGAKLTGQIAGVYPNRDGGCRLSISWDGACGEEIHHAVERKTYFRFRGVVIRCEVVGTPPKPAGDPQESFTIRLWDGTEFDVTASQISYRSRNSRCTEILTMGPARHILLQLYGLESNKKQAAEVESILQFEFANDVATV